MAIAWSSHLVRFEAFEVDLQAGELRRRGVKLRLPEQSFQILAMLLEHPGELVTREEIQKRLWPNDTIVEFENSISAAIRRLRLALGDSADEPRFVETLVRRGYRFVMEVERLGEAGWEEPSPGVMTHSGEQPGFSESMSSVSPRRLSRKWLFALAGSALLMAAAVFTYLATHSVPPKVSAYRKVTRDGRVKSGRLLTDGPRLYYSEILAGRLSIAQVPSSGGESVPVPTELPNPQILDISPTSSELLIVSRLSRSDEEGEFWILPLLSGLPRRLGDLTGSDAAWSPTTQHIVYVKRREVFLARRDGSESRKLVTLPMPASNLSWTPDGNRVRFDVGSSDNTMSLFEAEIAGGKVQPYYPAGTTRPWSVVGIGLSTENTSFSCLHEAMGSMFGPRLKPNAILREPFRLRSS